MSQRSLSDFRPAADNSCETCGMAREITDLGGRRMVRCGYTLKEVRKACGAWIDKDPEKRYWWPEPL